MTDRLPDQGIELPAWLARPRPNGSPALAETAGHIRKWLDEHGIPYQVHIYAARPLFNEALGLWLMGMSFALFVAVLAGWGTAALAISIVLVAVGVAEVLLNRPLVSRLGAATQDNIIVRHAPSPERGEGARREIVLSAHYDTKTELLDHDKRRVFTATLAPAMALCLLTGLTGWATQTFGLAAMGAGPAVQAIHVVGGTAVLLFGWGMGLNLATGRLLPRQSSGAVDDGGACAVLLEVARLAAHGEASLQNTALTIALFSGEEVTMQGSRAWVRSRDWPLPACSINLEGVGQDGEYFTWRADGTVLSSRPTDGPLTAELAAACRRVTGRDPVSLPVVNSDTLSFLAAGIPAAGLGSLDRGMGAAGLHGPLDAPGRLSPLRLRESAAILVDLLRSLDAGEGAAKGGMGRRPSP